MGTGTVVCLSLASDPISSGMQQVTDHSQNICGRTIVRWSRRVILKEYVEMTENIQCDPV